MRKILTASVALLMLAGCGNLEPYIKADKATFDAIAPEYQKYVDADPNLDQGQKDRRRRTLETWKLRIEKGGKPE